ncbi:Sulfotransferase family cytosolic 1B member 1 [Orchesella cincta]|uniref:Sulfotransferase family cytosolic 1B member 1 n=1 Tax=Orchesella cincta TaxID=48709 RepID=A0A1D2NEV6_ORCCI|nr:Sulfotransferase family cytosolic 1B member 1 [Orchesella cincta]
MWHFIQALKMPEIREIITRSPATIGKVRHAEEEDSDHAHNEALVYHDLFKKFGNWNICYLPKHYSNHSAYIEQFQVRDEDVWVVSFIKAGTTWTQEMVWMIGNDMDFENAKTILPVRFPYFEFDASWDENGNDTGTTKGKRNMTSMEIVHHMPSTRYIKTHLPFNLLPRQMQTRERSPKIIYVARNPKDVCVSFYHHKVLTEAYDKSIDEFVDEFVDDVSQSNYAPYWSHVKEFWKRRHQSNILFITFEDMKRDLRSVVEKASKFMGKTLSESDMQKLLSHLSFESMKSNPYVNYDEITDKLTRVHGTERKTHFMRKGKVGSWKEELSVQSVQKMDAWISKNRIPGLWEDVLGQELQLKTTMDLNRHGSRTRYNYLFKLISSSSAAISLIILISFVKWVYSDSIDNTTHDSLVVPFLRKEDPPNGIHSDIQLTTFFYIIFDELGITHGSHPWPPFYPFGSLFGPSKRSIKMFDKQTQRSGKLHESIMSLPSGDAFPGGERALIYPKLEKIFASVGWQGRPCLLRLVCETHEYPLKYGYGLLGEMFTLFFTVSQSPFAESHLPTYLEAEELGLAGNCTKYINFCEKSLFKWERKQQSKSNDVDSFGKELFNSIVIM